MHILKPNDRTTTSD